MQYENEQHRTVSYREIPYNYTSADDQRVVELLLGEDAWRILEDLRCRRVTGRSARLLMRVLGELFVFHRNPFLRETLLQQRTRRKNWFSACLRDLELVEASAGPNREVIDVVERCREELSRRLDRLNRLRRERRRLRKYLGAIVGGENVRFDPHTLVAHSTDATDWRLYLPEGVVFPDREEQVPLLVETIRKLGYRMIPRGAGTGLTGGAVPTAPGCIIINTERLNRIRGVRQVRWSNGETGWVISLEAGVITEDAMRYASRLGLVFATDPTSAWACTIGGNIAENAGGKTAVLWGTAIDNLVSFKIAMPDGVLREVKRLDFHPRRIREDDEVIFGLYEADGTLSETFRLSGRDLRKPGLGKDITNKALGGVPGLQKEGVDGIITSAEFVLHRPFPFRRTFCLEFFGDSMEEAAQIIERFGREFVGRPGAVLMALEHFDEEYVKAVEYRTKAPRGDRPKAVLLMDLVSEEDSELETGEKRLQALVSGSSTVYCRAAADEAEAERFWSDRKRLGAIAARTNAFKLNEDIVLPLSALPDFTRWVESRNAQEDRVNQLELLVALEDLLKRQIEGKETEKDFRCELALERIEQAHLQIASADATELQDERALGELRADLLRLLEPFSEMTQAVGQTWRHVRSRRIVIATHMHAGDGNVHVNIPVFSNDLEMLRRAFAAADDVMAEAVRSGGVVSGEHGIGFTKLKYLEPVKIQELEAYRDRVDPERLMNPGKFSDLRVPRLVFTPSFNLIELEARILRYGRLESLAHRIAQCVRCGRCKVTCCMFYPAKGLFSHPRNKNLSLGAIVETVLYETQRAHSTRFESLRYLKHVAERCTLCHRCLAPCPVKIDTAEITLAEREILAGHGLGEKPLVTRTSLAYLASRSERKNRLLRPIVLVGGTRMQRLAHSLLPTGVSAGVKLPGVPPGPLPLPSPRDLRRHLPACGPRQALWFRDGNWEEQPTVFYFPGCGSERLFASIGAAALYLLRSAGYSVVIPPPYLCCGFPHRANAEEELQRRAELFNTVVFSQIREMFRFLDFEACAFTCGTCREALAEVQKIFQAPALDVAALWIRRADSAAASGERARTQPDRTYIYHAPCHDSLDGAGLKIIGEALGDHVFTSPHCCSQAGTLAFTSPELAAAMVAKKRESMSESTPVDLAALRAWLTNCPSCLQGLTRLLDGRAPCRHLVEELALSRGGPEWHNDLARLLRDCEVVTF
ncbi:MAG TPA: DUF3683 domain-containing protein [Acidobacteriota bacterium]|nr:DUF3683 domain-containing protein [Acidobacteriota bacterium]HRR25330.1 DUF3683 domain-containing protein [Acidobacteriota bacterium]HRV07252.1 DUF3683 domain-containing protein [Acidobacteriota bacterium]